MAFEDLVAAADKVAGDLLGRGDVTYAPAVGSPVVVRGIFDDGYLRATPGTPGVSTSAPKVFFRLADLPVDPRHDTPTITIPGKGRYEVIEVEPDSLGAGVLLSLQEIP